MSDVLLVTTTSVIPKTRYIIKFAKKNWKKKLYDFQKHRSVARVRRVFVFLVVPFPEYIFFVRFFRTCRTSFLTQYIFWFRTLPFAILFYTFIFFFTFTNVVFAYVSNARPWFVGSKGPNDDRSVWSLIQCTTRIRAVVRAENGTIIIAAERDQRMCSPTDRWYPCRR